MAQIDLRDLQGDILRAYGNDYDHTSYAFVHMTCPPEQARAWFSGLLDHVTTAEPWKEGKPLTTLNVAVTASGLAALGVSEAVVATFSKEFREGMASRAPRLGDVGVNDPSGWEPGLGSGDAHVLLTINAQEKEDHVRALGKMRAAMDDAGGLKIVHQQDTALLAGAREHFGYADGFAQPAVEGASDAKAPGGGVLEKDGRWRALAAGEFVLGYPDEDSRDDPKRRLPAAPLDPLGKSGTYMVWRKLYQDVALWRRVLRDAAELYTGGDEHKLAAKVVGRWADGSPLVTHPDKPDPTFDPAARGANDFRYDSDLKGLRCPVGAHIRRSNPRDALGFETSLTFRHRMIRRGMPYGDPLPEGVDADDKAERGLVFVSFQASISRQFEAVQIQWLNDGNIFGLGHDKDFLLGDANGTGKMTIQGNPPFFLSPQENFVRTRGGEYLFVPGLSALAALADGTAGELMGLDDEIRERFRDASDKLAEEVSVLAGHGADKAAAPLFRFMRKHKPIIATKDLTVVALAEDVKEVLGDSKRFTAGLYGPKMEAVTGPFILGVDDTPLYHHDHAAMDRAVRREDMPLLGDAMLGYARELVAAAGDEIDVVSELADPALIRAIDDYFGTPGPDAQTQARWARDIFWELFINVNNLAETRDRALDDAALWRVHLDALIDARKAALKAGEDVPDDVLTRLLRFQDEGEPNFFDISIRHNILGNIVGWIPTVSNSMARAVNVLLEREDELEGAQAAARAGDRELVGKYVWESLRFSPQNFALLRLVGEDTTIAAGTDRETPVKAGSTVFAGTLSAMHDERAIADPEDFKLDRPWSDYMLFGTGLHTCYGQQIVRNQLPAMMTALLEGRSIKRAGRLKWEGPFPSSMPVRFDDD